MSEYFTVPHWAARILDKVRAEEGMTDPLEIRWTWAGPRQYWHWPQAHIDFSGDTSYSRAQERVWIHELSHWVTGPVIEIVDGVPEIIWHGPAFYRTAWRLYRRFGVDIEYALQFESGYQIAAVPTALGLGLTISADRLAADEARWRRPLCPLT